MPIACLRVPHFALRVALLDRPALDGAPLVLATPHGGRAVVADVTPEAAERGIRSGMALREVTALCPEAVVLPPNPVREAAVFESLLERLEALSPLVEPDETEPGTCYIDLAGLERRLGPLAAAAARLLSALPPALRPRAGVAPGTFTARVAAGRAAPGGVEVVASDQVRAFLAAAPVSFLPLPVETLRRLDRLGLTTLGALAALPGAAVAARFGPAGRQAWDLAQGRDTALVTPRRRELRVVEELTMPAPTASREMLVLGLRQLIVRAFGRPVLRDRAVRGVRVRASLE
ncbi:MAG: DNA polymerase Y family protein, partial [Chloroflexota bacterium]|nr:DNA polymerase Y family protein [Chloroflexota bacterium]